MQKIFGYIKNYMAQASLPVHALAVLFLAALVFANYHFGINRFIEGRPFSERLFYWYFLLLLSFSAPYFLYRTFLPQAVVFSRNLMLLIAIAPMIFAWKMSAQITPFHRGPSIRYWNIVVYFPVKAAVVLLLLVLCAWMFGKDKTLFGLKSRTANWTPYFLMLLLMVPLIVAASQQPDFGRVYPKYQHLQNALPLWKVLLFELSYGSDFFTIEVFFRGFLVIYFSRWAGRYAILPMALFYCVIHFGKPLGECISSFFGGMLLGIVSYHSQSIWGGLMVHLGIAWMMELPNPLSL